MTTRTDISSRLFLDGDFDRLVQDNIHKLVKALPSTKGMNAYDDDTFQSNGQQFKKPNLDEFLLLQELEYAIDGRHDLLDDFMRLSKRRHLFVFQNGCPRLAN